MITVILQAESDGEALSRSLVPLVEGAMEGVISGVTVFSDAVDSKQEIDRICDLSGADFCEAQDLPEVINAAKDKWILLLEAGARLEGDWLSGVVNHMNKTQNLGRFALAMRSSDQPWWTRLFARKTSKTAISRACLMPKSVATNAVQSAKSPEAMARGRAMKLIDGGRIRAAE